MDIEPAELPDVEGVDDETRQMLIGRYGHGAIEVLRIAAGDPELARRISPELPDILAEAVVAARYEQARGVADVLLRRTRLGLLDAPNLTAPDAPGPRAVAKAMATELDWDDTRVAQELEDWRAVAVAEGLAPGAPATSAAESA
jgi:glycerol-3-phosphate dehydrogenase